MVATTHALELLEWQTKILCAVERNTIVSQTLIRTKAKPKRKKAPGEFCA